MPMRRWEYWRFIRAFLSLLVIISGRLFSGGKDGSGLGWEDGKGDNDGLGDGWGGKLGLGLGEGEGAIDGDGETEGLGDATGLFASS